MREIHPDEQRFIDIAEGEECDVDEDDRPHLPPARPMKPATISELVALEPVTSQGAHPMTVMALLAFLRKHPGEAKAVIRRTSGVLLRRNASRRPTTPVDRSRGDRGFSVTVSEA